MPQTKAPLAHRLATTATGYGAVIGGILDVRTIMDSKNGAALNAIYATGRRVLSNCTDPDCDCKLTLLAQLEPSIRIVPVKIEVSHD